MTTLINGASPGALLSRLEPIIAGRRCEVSNNGRVYSSTAGTASADDDVSNSRSDHGDGGSRRPDGNGTTTTVDRALRHARLGWPPQARRTNSTMLAIERATTTPMISNRSR